MRNRKWLIAAALFVLVALPWPVERWRTDRERRQDARDDELFALYDCFPVRKCVADFDGDGTADHLDVVPDGVNFYGSLVATVGGREVLRLPFYSADNTFRTHVAVLDDGGRSRLLIYEGARRPSRGQPLRAAYVWGRVRLFEVEPNDFDQEILGAMAAHDDTGGWHARVFRDITRNVRLAAYYALLLVLVGLICCRWRRAGGAESQFNSFRG